MINRTEFSYLKMGNKYYIILLLTFFLSDSCSKDTNIIPTIDPNNSISPGVYLIQHTFQGKELIIVGSNQYNFITSFENTSISGELFEFAAIRDSLPVIMKDNYGGRWNIMGKAISGPAKGKFLKPTTSYMAYWFGFGTFYPSVDVYNLGTNNVEINDSISDGWLINKNMISIGSLVPDAVPSIDSPEHINFKLRDFLNGFFVDDEELVLGLVIDGIPIAYPEKLLNWHEIVNDNIENKTIAVSYCPLTGSGMAWSRSINDQETTFGVSGLLYNSNLILYDRSTKSYWSQMRQDCIHGDLINTKTDNFSFLETSWQTWKTIFPETRVLSQDTGYDWDYDTDPHGDYATNHNQISYPIVYYDNRIPSKERVHGIIVNGKALVFRFSDFGQLQ